MIVEENTLAGQASIDTVTAQSAAKSGARNRIARWERVSSLGGQIDSSAVQELLGSLGDEDPLISWAAGVALSRTGARLRRRARMGAPVWSRRTSELTFTGLFTLLSQGLEDADPRRRAATADALALWDHEPAVTSLLQAMRDSQPLVRASVTMALGHIGDKAAVDSLLSALFDPSFWVRRAAADALGAIGDLRAVSPLRQILTDSQPLVRASAVRALGHMRTARARKTLEHCTQDDDGAVRWYAARSLAHVGGVGSMPVLERLKENDDSVLFGQSTAEVAARAIDIIEKRERGLWQRLRRTFYAVHRRLQRAS